MERLQDNWFCCEYWIQKQGLKVVVLFGAAAPPARGGVIKRITGRTSPAPSRSRPCRRPPSGRRPSGTSSAMSSTCRPPARWSSSTGPGTTAPTSSGSWALHPEEHEEFLRSCPEFERMLVRSGIILIKYWFSVSFEEQRKRFETRNAERRSSGGSSPTWTWPSTVLREVLDGRDITFQYTDIKRAPWFVVPSDDKRAARLNCISDLLSHFPYEDVAPEVVELPEMQQIHYVRPPMHEQTFVPQVF